MKSPPYSTLHALFVAQLLKAGRPVYGDWIAAFMEALYDLQREQAMRVIGTYQRFHELRSDATEPAKAAAEERPDTKH
jgi:hypothetical protein